MTEYTTKAANTNEPAEQAYTPNAAEESSAASESFAMNHADFSAIQAQLAAEGLGVLDGEALAPEGQSERPLYLATPASAGESEGIDVADLPESTTDDTPDEEPEVTVPRCPVLSLHDRELLARIRELGGAATVSEIATHAGASIDRLAGGDFAENGVAFYRANRGHTLLALAGATEAELTKAANRAEAERISVTFDKSVTVASALAGTLAERLRRLGGSSSLQGTVRSLVNLGYSREAIHAVLGELYRRGSIRLSIRGKAPEGVQNGERDTRPRFVTLANAPEGALAAAAKRYSEDHQEIPARRVEAAEKARRRGQDKAFAAPVVPFGGTWVAPEQQTRALYIERARAAYHEADPKGLHEATLRLAATDTLPAEEVTLYTAQPAAAREFFAARVKARILTGLSRNGVLTGRKILTVLFPKKASEIIRFLSEGRGVSDLSPTLAEPYELFASAVNELISEGKVERTSKGLALAEQDQTTETAAAEVKDWADFADRDPEPERQSGPDAHGADKYAADMAGAHDHRSIATGPEAPSTRPAQRRRTAKGIQGAICKATAAKNAKGGEEASGLAEASLTKAQCNQAWNEARARYMRTLDAQDRLELYLKFEGEQRLERMVEAAEEPNELYRAMIVLKDEGRIQVRQSGGYTLISAATKLDREELAAELVELMARVGSREIYVPEGTALHTRVAAVEAAREQTSRLSRAAQPAVA